MVGLLGVVWMLAACDLVFTMWAHRYTLFFECNPIARAMLDADRFKTLAAFKTLTMVAATLLFWATRRHRFSEGALWGLAMAYVVLMFQWSAYTAQADDLIHYRQVADWAATPYIIPIEHMETEAPKTHTNRDLITLAGSTPVRRMSRPW